MERRKERTYYYVPCYLRHKLKHFHSISLETLTAEFSSVLLFSVYYGDLPAHVVEQLQEGIVLQFNRNEPVELRKSMEITCQSLPKKRMLTYTVRKFLSAAIEGHLTWSPFELITIYLIVTVRSLLVERAEPSAVQEVVRFNLMDHEDVFLKMSFTREDEFGNYRLANSLVNARYLNKDYF